VFDNTIGFGTDSCSGLPKVWLELLKWRDLNGRFDVYVVECDDVLSVPGYSIISRANHNLSIVFASIQIFVRYKFERRSSRKSQLAFEIANSRSG
jgi:hypothetical protein